MDTIGFELIFLSAILLLISNLINKVGIKDTVSFLYVKIVMILCLSPIAFIYKDQLPNLIKFWPLILFSTFGNALKTWATNMGYRYGDYTYIYPVTNAFPIFLTALLGALFLHKTGISTLGYIGLTFVFLGCCIFPIKDFKTLNLKKYISISMVFCLFAAIGASLSSLFDKEIMAGFKEISPQTPAVFRSLLYDYVLNCVASIFLFPFLFIDRYALKIDFNKIKFNFKSIVLVAIFSVSAYLCVLLGMTHIDNASYVVAIRQIGIPLSILVGYFVLKENLYLGKIIGAGAVVVGIILISIK